MVSRCNYFVINAVDHIYHVFVVIFVPES